MNIIKNALEDFIIRLNKNVAFHKSITEEHILTFTEYGDRYKNTLGFRVKELQIAIIELKISFLESILKSTYLF